MSMREIVTVADVPDNAGCEASLDARDTGGGMAAAVPSPARTTPRLLSVGTLLLALLAVVLEADASRAWVGLAVVALVLVEATERLLRRPECPRPEWLRSGLWACLATLACVAAAVALPLSWWLPVAVIIVVLYAALTLRGRLVTGITAAGSLAMLLLSSLPNLSEPGPGLAASEAAVVLAVALPAGAWLVCARSMRARRDRAALRGVVQRLRLAREEMERSEDALRRWNAELRSEVDRKTDALEERNQYLSIINAVSFALAEPMDDERSLEQAVRLVACLLGVRAAQAYTEVRPGDPIDLFVTVAPEDVHAPRIPEALLRAVAKSGRPLSSVDGPPADGAAVTGALLPALSSCGRLLPDPLPDLGEPYHVVPLVAKGRVLGSFALVGTAGLRNDDDGRHLLLLVGREMGIAIENARLYQEAIEKAEREAFLTEVSGLLNGPGRGDRALPQVLEAFRLATKSEEVMLVTLPEESRDVVIAGISIREGAEPRLDRMARSLTRQVADRHRPLILGAGGEAPLSDRLVDDGVTTLAVAPIYLRRGDSHDPSLSHLAEHEPVRPAPTLTGALVVVGTDGEWRNDETMLIERVADILARRIQADEFVAVQQQRIRELTGLAEVARTMQSGADDERLYHGFAASLRRLMRYEALYIARVDDSMQLVGVPSFGQSGRAMPSPPFTATDVAHPWFSIRTPLLWMSGSDPGPGFLPDDSRYAVVVPLRPKGQMLGLAIVVVPRAVRADQLPIVEQAVEQLALALDGATLYQQATARASHIQALSNLARIVASVVNLREAFAAFSEEVRWLIPFDRAVMFLVDEGQQSVEPYAMYPDGILRPEPTPLVGSLAGVAVAAGTAVSLRRDDPRYAALDWDSVGPGVTEMAAVPIRHGGRTSAVFALVTDATEAYGIGDMDALDEVAGLLAVTIDRIRLFEQADYSAKHDLLTDLPNYRFLQERFQALRDRAGAPDEGGEPPRVAVLVVDMDNLKVFNDTLGHEVGDRVIREVGRILRESCRTGDFVARTGGDEFVIVMEGADGEAALAVANRIHAAVEEIEIEFERAEMRAGVSVGIAVTPGDAETPADLLHSADQAMYDAKFAGGQRTRLAGERAGNPGPRALRGRSIRLADTLTRTLVTGGTSEELAAVSLAQRWASAVVGRASLAPELLPQLRLVIASGASRRFQAPRGDRDQMLACYLVDRIEEDWVGIAEDQLGAQLLFLAGALLDIAWMTVPLSTGTAVPIETALARIAEAHPGAVGFPVWGAITGVVTEDAERRRAA